MDQGQALVDYGVAEGQSLAFSLPTKKFKPTGTAPVSGGTLSLDPKALETARGEIRFDLAENRARVEGAASIVIKRGEEGGMRCDEMRGVL